jgi:Ni2+-binding GTPase involved in maturation of urease and hydrogenase
VGSGKTALVDLLCKRLRDRLDIALSGVTANAILHNPEGFSV